jgi:hypothetical protein
MSEYQERPTPVAGYRELSGHEIDAVNFVKSAEKQIAETWRALGRHSALELDRRWMAVARTHFQEGFSAVVRAITRPADPFEETE